jgi:hypothetical protein
MTWLAPLGFLGLIGLIILIIIYIIKPNFQLRYISTTYVWKRSLKYRKKKIPLNKLRNILLFLCQVAVLTATSCILAQPFIHVDNSKSDGDVILIIDASASMHTETEARSRLSRAVDAARADANAALEKDKSVTVILASDTASFLVRQVGKDRAQMIYDAMDILQETPENVFTYGTPDMEGAIKLAEQITSYAKNSSVTVYTDTQYLNAGDVKVHNIKHSSEWNAAVLDVRATIVENYYRIEIDLASYGADTRMMVDCEIFDVNETGTVMALEKEVYCSGDAVTTLVLGYISPDMPETEAERIDENISVFSYEHICVRLSVYDSLAYDNAFYLYGGKKPVLKVQYASALPNNFWSSSLMVLQDIVKDQWALEITEVSEGQPATEGFDIYIFEHEIPTTIPSDGVVFYVNPKTLPAAAGIRLGTAKGSAEELFLSAVENHAIMKNIVPERISVTQFLPVTSADGYITLLGYQDYPLLMMREDVDQKILLLPFSLHYSNLSMVPDFPLLLKNTVDYFFPATLNGYVYDIGQTVQIHARANELTVTGPETKLSLQTFPSEMTVVRPGTYTMSQLPMSGEVVIENIFVKIPAAESNINPVESTLTNPYFFEETDSDNVDLLFYFALAVVTLLFLEWWLKSREQI